MCDCSNCDELNIPIGPTGATGATGSTGLTGSAGADGVDGTTVVVTYNNITGSGTPASLVETTLLTTSVPANTLNSNGDELEAYIFFDATLTGDDTTLRVKFGGKTLVVANPGTLFAGTTLKILKIKISRINSTSQLWTIETISPFGLGTFNSGLSIDSSTEDLTTNLTFEITGQNDIAPTANQLILYKATLYKYLAP